MTPSETIKAARLRKGLTVQEAAALCNITEASFYDLEDHDDEIQLYSLEELFNICSHLDLRPLQLVDHHPLSHDTAARDAVQSIHQHFHAMSATALNKVEDVIRWELSPIVKDGFALIQFPMDALQAICEVTNTVWVEVFVELHEEWLKRKENG